MLKVGDTVRTLVDHGYKDCTVGTITKITEIYTSHRGLVHVWVTGTKSLPGGLCFKESDLELVEEEPSVMGVGLNLGPKTQVPILDINPDKGGTKADSNKPDISLIPTDAIWGTAAALTYGAKKYARHNFRKGIDYSRLVAAAMRHLTAWNEGANTDDESGLSHLDHAMASLAMLKFMDVNKPECDDRFKLEKKSLTAKALDTFPNNDGKNR